MFKRSKPGIQPAAPPERQHPMRLGPPPRSGASTVFLWCAIAAAWLVLLALAICAHE